MFLLLFNYVFGGAITVGSGARRPTGCLHHWLIPGILVQTACVRGNGHGPRGSPKISVPGS